MKSDDYQTDAWIEEIFSGWGDPCPLDPDFDGLSIDWGWNTFCNPPYSDPLAWVEKGILEHQRHGITVVFLLKNDSSTKWFAKLHEAGAHMIWIQPRLRHKTGNRANFPSCFAVLSRWGRR